MEFCLRIFPQAVDFGRLFREFCLRIFPWAVPILDDFLAEFCLRLFSLAEILATFGRSQR